MKHLPFYILLVLLPTCSYGQEAENSIGSGDNDAPVHIELITEGDTVIVDQPFYLYLIITNTSKKSIYVPKEIDVISDLYPNGIKGPWDGAVVNLKMSPVPSGGTIFYEVTSVSSHIHFEKIRPNSSIKLPIVDLRKYIDDFNQKMNSEEMKIKSGRPYQIMVKYGNSWKKEGKEDKTFTGSLSSHEKEVYVE